MFTHNTQPTIHRTWEWVIGTTTKQNTTTNNKRTRNFSNTHQLSYQSYWSINVDAARSRAISIYTFAQAISTLEQQQKKQHAIRSELIDLYLHKDRSFKSRKIGEYCINAKSKLIKISQLTKLYVVKTKGEQLTKCGSVVEYLYQLIGELFGVKWSFRMKFDRRHRRHSTHTLFKCMSQRSFFRCS